MAHKPASLLQRRSARNIFRKRKHQAELSRFFGQIQSRHLSTNAPKRIAILGLNLLDPGLKPIRDALADNLCRHNNWHVVFLAESTVEAFKVLLTINCDGVLARVVSKEIASIARKVPCPLVNFSSYLKNPGVHSVVRDDRGLGKMCAQHLLKMGCLRIGIVTVPYNDWCDSEVESGFRQEVQNSPRPVKIFRHVLDSEPPGKSGLANFRKWLGKIKKPVAIFTVTDAPASALMNVCRSMGLRIPADVAFITAGGHLECISPCKPSLTHSQTDGSWLLDVACEHLESLMRDPSQPVQRIKVPCPDLVSGESTRTLVSDDPLLREAVDYLDSHLLEGINIADIVSALGCSRRSLERHFWEHYQTHLHEYLISRRIEEGRLRIENDPNCKLSSIARECGYGNYQAFKLAFKSLTGKLPSEWRDACHAD